MCLALSQQCKTPLLLQKEPVKKKTTITEGTWLHHQGAPVCNNLTSCHLPHIADIGTLSMLWGRMIQALWGDTTHVSQLDETMSIRHKHGVCNYSVHAFCQNQHHILIKRTNINLLQSSTFLHFLQLQILRMHWHWCRSNAASSKWHTWGMVQITSV